MLPTLCRSPTHPQLGWVITLAWLNFVYKPVSLASVVCYLGYHSVCQGPTGIGKHLLHAIFVLRIRIRDGFKVRTRILDGKIRIRDWKESYSGSGIRNKHPGSASLEVFFCIFVLAAYIVLVILLLMSPILDFWEMSEFKPTLLPEKNLNYFVVKPFGLSM